MSQFGVHEVKIHWVNALGFDQILLNLDMLAFFCKVEKREVTFALLTSI